MKYYFSIQILLRPFRFIFYLICYIFERFLFTRPFQRTMEKFNQRVSRSTVYFRPPISQVISLIEPFRGFPARGGEIAGGGGASIINFARSIMERSALSRDIGLAANDVKIETNCKSGGKLSQKAQRRRRALVKRGQICEEPLT